MANREALRELQSRLASRLREAQSHDATPSWLAVEAQGQGFLFPLEQAGEIFPWSAPLPVPYTRAWFLGVANLRGGLYGVIDLVAFLGQTVAAPQAGFATGEGHLVAFNARLEVNGVLRVDRLAGLRKSEAFLRHDPPAADAQAYIGACKTDAEGRRWQEVHLQRLAQHPRFLDVTA